MKRTAIILALASLSIGAFAGQKPAKAPAKIKCAVETGNEVTVTEATKHHMFADYKGNRYFFCCDGCPQQFKAHPEKFAKNAHIKIPKAK